MATQKQDMPISGELERFIRLHDGMAAMNRSWLELAPPDRLDWERSEDAIHRFGDGRTPVTIRNLFIGSRECLDQRSRDGIRKRNHAGAVQ